VHYSIFFMALLIYVFTVRTSSMHRLLKEIDIIILRAVTQLKQIDIIILRTAGGGGGGLVVPV